MSVKMTTFAYQIKGKEFIMTAEQQRALRKFELYRKKWY